jgi:sugar phosphate permease
MLCYLDRTNISTAIVPMAEQFGWDKQFCGAVLSAFFAGYGATQVLGGQWSDKYGGSAVLAGGLALWSAATALTPLAASWGTVPLLAARTLLGMGQVGCLPLISCTCPLVSACYCCSGLVRISKCVIDLAKLTCILMLSALLQGVAFPAMHALLAKHVPHKVCQLELLLELAHCLHADIPTSRHWQSCL